MTGKVVIKKVVGRTKQYFIHAKENPDKTVIITLEIRGKIFKSYTYEAENFLSKIINKKALPKSVKIAIRDVLREFDKYRLDTLFFDFK